MSKKKVLLIAAGAYYLGALNLPKAAKKMWKYREQAPVPLRVAETAVFVVIFPPLYPFEYVLIKTGQQKKVVKKLQDWTEIMKFKMDLDNFGEQSTRKADI